MSNDPIPSSGASVAAPAGLQFERAEFAQNPAAPCAFCKQPASGEYYQVNGRIACANCRGQIAQAFTGGSGAARTLRALIAGLGAAIAGFLIFWGIRAASGYEFALVAILVGWMVGKAVRWGSANRGGRLYQVLAVLLTYLSIASTYTPDILSAMHQDHAERAARHGSTKTADDAKVTDAASTGEKTTNEAAAEVKHAPFVLELVVAFILSLAAPFLAGVSNIIGWFIIAVGLMQAWRLTKAARIDISGPFLTGAASV